MIRSGVGRVRRGQPDDTATAVASSSTEAAASGDPWAGLFEDLLAAYRSLAADVVTVTRDQLPVYRSIPVVDVVQGVELELREVLRSARAGAPAICEAELARLALGQRLPARPHAAAVRHLVLERGHHPDDCSPAPRFVQMGVTNGLVRLGGVTMLGSPVDLAAIDRDTYLVAGITDHLCPWQSCYRSTQVLSGSKRFVLSTSGHIAAMVNPPGNDKARYQVAKECPEDPQEWLRHAENGHGSWWPDYASWLAERCGEQKAAPEELGGGGLEPIGDAPDQPAALVAAAAADTDPGRG